MFRTMVLTSRIRTSLSALALVGALATPARAQLELPAPSPAASVSQRVGLTDIAVEYSSPAVKGRKIWGELVPYGKPWRSGANAATKITFSKPVTFGGKPVPAGSYAIITHPTAKGWTVSLNKDTTLFVGGKPYNAKDDLVRVAATTAEVPHRERLTYVFSGTTDDATSLDLEWEKLRISVPIKVETASQVQASIKDAVDGAWRTHAMAARYLAENTKDYDTALAYADKSIAIQQTWLNHWIRAVVLSKKGDYVEARKSAQSAWDLGQKDKFFFYKDQVAAALKEWKDKS